MLLNPHRFASPAPVDPYAAYVAMLLRMNGANNSTTFTDEKGRAITPAYNAKIVTTYGDPCAEFPSVYDGLYMADDPTFVAGSSDFCIEGWVKTTSVGSNYGGFFYGATLAGSRANAMAVIIDLGGRIKCYSWDNGWVMKADGSGAASVTNGVWHHVAVTKYLNKLHAFVDGIEQPYTAQPNISSMNLFGSGGWSLCRDNAAPRSYDNNIKNVDDYRITIGVPRYTGNFTPPARGSI